MGDYAAATLTLYGVAGKEEQVLETLEPGWNLEWGVSGFLAVSDLTNVVELYDTDCSTGWIFDGCGSALAELGIAYEFSQEARYEFDGTVERFTPELGVFQSLASQEGEVHVLDAWIERAIDESTTLDALRDKLLQLTGKSWRDALALLAIRPVRADGAT